MRSLTKIYAVFLTIFAIQTNPMIKANFNIVGEKDTSLKVQNNNVENLTIFTQKFNNTIDTIKEFAKPFDKLKSAFMPLKMSLIDNKKNSDNKLFLSTMLYHISKLKRKTLLLEHKDVNEINNAEKSILYDISSKLNNINIFNDLIGIKLGLEEVFAYFKVASIELDDKSKDLEEYFDYVNEMINDYDYQLSSYINMFENLDNNQKEIYLKIELALKHYFDAAKVLDLGNKILESTANEKIKNSFFRAYQLLEKYSKLSVNNVINAFMEYRSFAFVSFNSGDLLSHYVEDLNVQFSIIDDPMDGKLIADLKIPKCYLHPKYMHVSHHRSNRSLTIFNSKMRLTQDDAQPQDNPFFALDHIVYDNYDVCVKAEIAEEIIYTAKNYNDIYSFFVKLFTNPEVNTCEIRFFGNKFELYLAMKEGPNEPKKKLEI